MKEFDKSKTIVAFLLFCALSAQAWEAVGPTAPKITNIHFFDEQNGVGGGGKSIYHTSDGGSTWTLTTSINDGYYYENVEIIHFVTTQHGYCRIGQSNLHRTLDGGYTWEETEGGHGKIQQMRCLGTDTVLCAANYGRVSYTHDGGDTWVKKDIGPNGNEGNFYSCDIVDPTLWFVAGAERRVMKSTDAGATWTEFTAALPENAGTSLYGIRFRDENIGWVHPINSATLYETTDGGQTFSARALEHIFDGQEIQSLSTDTLYAPGSGFSNRILYTYDFGRNWISVRLDGVVNVGDLYMLDGHTGFCTGGASAVVKTTDNWQTHSRLDDQTGGNVNDIAFYNDTVGIAVGSSGLIKRTADGARTWQAMSRPSAADLAYVLLIDSAIILCNNYISHDSGQTWESITVHDGINYTLRNAHYLGDGHIIANATSYFYQTKDFGETWEWIQYQTPIDFNGQDIIYSDRGILAAVPDKSKSILISRDNGLNWELFAETGDTIQDVEILDDTTAIAISTNGKVLRTIDGGATWDEQVLSSSKLASVVLTSRKNGWIFSDDKYAFHTVDSGKTWSAENLETYLQLGSNSNVQIMKKRIAYRGDNMIWLAGCRDLILRNATEVTLSPTVSCVVPSMQVPVLITTNGVIRVNVYGSTDGEQWEQLKTIPAYPTFTQNLTAPSEIGTWYLRVVAEEDESVSFDTMLVVKPSWESEFERLVPDTIHATVDSTQTWVFSELTDSAETREYTITFDQLPPWATLSTESDMMILTPGVNDDTVKITVRASGCESLEKDIVFALEYPIGVRKGMSMSYHPPRLLPVDRSGALRIATCYRKPTILNVVLYNSAGRKLLSKSLSASSGAEHHTVPLTPGRGALLLELSDPSGTVRSRLVNLGR